MTRQTFRIGAALLAGITVVASCSVVNAPDEPDRTLPSTTTTGTTSTTGSGGSDGGTGTDTGGTGATGGGTGGACAAVDEVCDGEDNDCNELVDDAIEPISCGVGACAQTVAGCDDGEVPVCVPGEPSAESCNGTDDDCNGDADDAALDLMCPLPENAISVECAGGAGCVATCPDGVDDCEPGASTPCNTDTLTSDLHCGGCNAPCDQGQDYTCAAGECVPRLLWVFANYNGGATAWNPAVAWSGAISCGTTCGHVGRTAVGVRFICNLYGNPDTEGCTAATDGQYGAANCGLWINEGVLANNGNTEDCAGGQLAACVSSSCSEYVTWHAIECQCAI